MTTAVSVERAKHHHARQIRDLEQLERTLEAIGRAVGYVREHEGQELRWRSFARHAGVGERRLGLIVSTLLYAGVIEQPDSTKIAYRLGPAARE